MSFYELDLLYFAPVVMIVHYKGYTSKTEFRLLCGFMSERCSDLVHPAIYTFEGLPTLRVRILVPDFSLGGLERCS